MHREILESTAWAMVCPGKGILAADESTRTMTKRLEILGVDSTADTRRGFRELLFTAQGAEQCISGVILYDETIRQLTSKGYTVPSVLKDRGILTGIKVDTGTSPLAGWPGETITEGLDGLRARLADYRGLGARFAKWRAVIKIADDRPSRACIESNAHALARYAALCQEIAIVPIVEPEVLMEGHHTIDRSQEVTTATLRAVFDELSVQGVLLEGIVLKPNMVLSGYDCPQQASIDEVAERTLACLGNVVPAAVPGIAFLSGGQDEELATAHLNAMNGCGPHPWELTFSYGRALQNAPLKAWAADPSDVATAQAIFLSRARRNSAARDGRYEPETEQTLVA